MHAMLPLLKLSDFPSLRRSALRTVQVNLGYRCNQQCVHCHVNAGPGRREQMDSETAGQVLEYLGASGAQYLDITGGAPEINMEFRNLVRGARTLGVRVIDRCNLTILEEPGFEDLAEFLAVQQVEIVASLPCYLEENVEQQRGKGVYASSIRVLQRLNGLGYGRDGSGLTLNLVYNPVGPNLPPPQNILEQDYRTHLGRHYGIVFNRLYTLANMPIQRFGSMLVSKGQFQDYMRLLRSAHLDANLDGVMCLSLISIDWRGFVYDCDFNQMLQLPLNTKGGRPRTHITEIMGVGLEGMEIVTCDHCYGCTAGQGSSCGGALS
ncbi:MAG: arsenosugar biosynthesis radical SAM (seleno)protein ArsS [Acidiferrobacterales bacterium]